MPSLSVPTATGKNMSSHIKPTGKNIVMPPEVRNPGTFLNWSGKNPEFPMIPKGAPVKTVNNQLSNTQVSNLKASAQAALHSKPGHIVNTKA